MNYKNRDDELIRKQKEAQNKYRQSITVKQNAANSKVYSKQALEKLASGGYKNRVPELKKTQTTVSQNNAPKTSAPTQTTQKVNLRDQGYPGSTRNDQIDFDYVMKNDKAFGKKGMLNLLQNDQEYRRKYGRDNTNNDVYYKRFGMSKNEVLDQYERYQREKHPILSGLEDITSAPDRAIAGAIGTAARKFFPYSDLDKFANSDFIQGKNKEVQRKRDYVYDSDKLTQGQKAAAKTVLEGGDFLFNNALAGLIGGGGAVGSASAGIGASFQPAKWLLPTLNGVMGYGGIAENTRHDLERQGIDTETANDYANTQGLIWGGIDALTAGAGSKAGAAARIAGKNAIQTAVKSAAKGFGIGVGKQGATEIANRLILGDQGTFNADVQGYMADGLDEEQATTRAFGNVLGRAASSGVLGGLLAGGASLIGSGINNVANRAAGTTMPSAVDTDGLNEYFVGPERIGQNPIGIGQSDVATPTTPQNNLPSLTGNNMLALPEKQLPTTVIPMTGTQGSIPLPDLTRPSTLNPLTGTALTEAKTQRTDIERQLRAKNKEINAQQDVLNKAAKKNKKAEGAKLKELKQQATELQEQKKEITRQINGETKPIKELLSKQDYDSIYDERTGLMSYVNLATKFAGDTADAKQLKNEIKNTLERFVETGSSYDYGDLAERVTQLHNLAESTRADYKTKNGTTYTYDDVFGDEDLIEHIINSRTLSKSVPAIHEGLKADISSIIPEADIDAAVAESVTGIDGQLTLDEVRTLQKIIDEGKFEKNIFDLDLQYFGTAKGSDNGYWLRVLGDPDFLEQEAKKAGVEPAVLKVYASANLGYDDFPTNNEVPPTNNNGGNVPPNTGRRSFFDDMTGDHTKTSKTYTNTGRRGGGWTEDEYNKYTDESMFQYFDKSEKASVDEANTMRSSEGRNAFKNRVMSKERLTGAEIDGLMMEWRELTAEARALEAQGKDASAVTKEGIRIFRKIQSQSSDNAQALQALQKWSRNTPEGMLTEAENIVNGKTEKEKGPLQKELEKFAKNRKKFQFSDDFVAEFLKDAEELQALTPNSYAARRKMAELGRKVNRQIPSTFGEKLTTYLMDNMLGNFRTLITRNAGGNIGLNALEQLAQRPLAAGIDSLVSRRTGQRTQAGLSREGLADYIQGFTKGLRDEADDVRTGLHTARTGENTLGRAISANRHVFREGSIMDRFDSLVKNGLSIGDRPFYEAVYKQTLGDYNRLRSQMGSEVGKLTDTEFKQYSEVAAKLNALSAVYQNDTLLSDALLELKAGIGDLSRGILGFDILSQFSMPFVKTPANVVDVGISYSPLGLVRNAYRTGKEIHDNTFDQNRFANETSRNILGTALTAGGIGLAAAGAMSGKYSDDKDEKQAQKEAGEQEYALITPAGQMDIGWSPVTGSNLVGAAAAYDAYKKGKGTPAQNAMAGIMAGGQALFDQSMFQGLQRLFGTGETYNSDEGIVGNMTNVVKSGLSQFIPSLARQAGQVIDPYERDLAGSNKSLSLGPLDNYDINSLAKVVPFLRQNVLAPKVNTSGELMRENQGRNVGMKILEDMILPGKLTEVNYSDLSKEAIRLSNETGNKFSYMPKADRKSVDEEGTLSNQEWVDYQQKYYGELTNAGTQLLNTEVYQNADADTQESMLSNVYTAMKSAINSEYNGKEVTGAAKKYVEAGGGEAGIKAVIDYTVAGNLIKQSGLSSSSKAAEEIKADVSAGNVEQAQQKVEQYGQHQVRLDALNQKYGYDMSLNDYLKKEATYEGGAEQWLKDKKAAEEAGIINAAGQVLTKDYAKIMSQAGSQSAKMERDLPTLNGMGMPKSSYYTYAQAINVNPGLSPNEFAKTFNEIDTEHPSGKRSITQDEMLAYFNKHHFTSEDQAMYYWSMYAPEGKKVPYLKSDGTWGKH